MSDSRKLAAEALRDLLEQVQSLSGYELTKDIDLYKAEANWEDVQRRASDVLAMLDDNAHYDPATHFDACPNGQPCRQTTTGCKPGTCLVRAALDAAPEDNYPTEFDDWWRDAPAFPTEYLAAQAAWNAALKRTPERDVAERVREACEKICDYMASGNTGSERLMAERCSYAINRLDLSQFTSCAGAIAAASQPSGAPKEKP